MAAEDLNTVVRVMWGTGGERGAGLVVGVCDAPTFVLVMEDGETITWRQDLCRGAKPEAEAAYWKARYETLSASLQPRQPVVPAPPPAT